MTSLVLNCLTRLTYSNALTKLLHRGARGGLACERWGAPPARSSWVVMGPGGGRGGVAHVPGVCPLALDACSLCSRMRATSELRRHRPSWKSARQPAGGRPLGARPGAAAAEQVGVRWRGKGGRVGHTTFAKGERRRVSLGALGRCSCRHSAASGDLSKTGWAWRIRRGGGRDLLDVRREERVFFLRHYPTLPTATGSVSAEGHGCAVLGAIWPGSVNGVGPRELLGVRCSREPNRRAPRRFGLPA